MGKFPLLLLGILVSIGLRSSVALADHNKALIVIGGSYANGKTPFNVGTQSPFYGGAVNMGIYVSLGDALVRSPAGRGFVVNEGQAGATTFSRKGCRPGPECGPAFWDSYSTQLSRALLRVTHPKKPGVLRAKYVVVSLPNDCLHSGAFGIPEKDSLRCNEIQLNGVVDRLIAVGKQAIAAGLIPVFPQYPLFKRKETPADQRKYQWSISQETYLRLRSLHKSRIKTELPKAMVPNIWWAFTPIEDGYHPSPETSKVAAQTLLSLLR